MLSLLFADSYIFLINVQTLHRENIDSDLEKEVYILFRMRARASLTLINLEIFFVMKFILKMNFSLDWEPRFNSSNCNHKLDLD